MLPVLWSLAFSISIRVGLKTAGYIYVWFQIGWCFVNYSAKNITFFPEYVKVGFPDPIMHLIKYHFNSSVSFFSDKPFKIIFSEELSIATGVGGCRSTISCRVVHT